MTNNTTNTVINTNRVNVTLTKAEKDLIRTYLVGSGLVYQALYYANIHYNTLFKSAMRGKPIRKDQRDRIMEFCSAIKKEKAA